MIFVTVGTQLPFDRLITAVDAWAGTASGRQVFAQIGPSDVALRHIEHAQFISPQQCDQWMAAAEAIVAHAGMGTILTALELGKPVLVMPRRAQFGEHRNDHQLSTARRLADLGRVSVAFDEKELPARLDDLCKAIPQPRIGRSAPERFVAGLRAFILGQSDPHAVPEGTSTDTSLARTAHSTAVE